MPEKKSIVLPPSHCTVCKTPILPWHNIPILSYFILKGKCNFCKTKFSLLYPLVETITPLIIVLLYFRFGLSIQFLQYTIVASIGIIVFFIDYKHHIIPDSLSISLVICGLIFIFFKEDYLNYLIGGVSGFLFFVATFYVFLFLTGKEGLGGGDVKLIAGIGLNLAWPGVIFTVFFSSVFAVIFACFKKINKGQHFSYGPFLVIASLLYILAGHEIIDFYLSLFLK